MTTASPLYSLAFYDFPAEHWIHLRTTSPMFATVRVRTSVTKGPGSRAAGLAMAFEPSPPSPGRVWTWL